jgi:hypothetical protein
VNDLTYWTGDDADFWPGRAADPRLVLGLIPVAERQPFVAAADYLGGAPNGAQFKIGGFGRS